MEQVVEYDKQLFAAGNVGFFFFSQTLINCFNTLKVQFLFRGFMSCA